MSVTLQRRASRPERITSPGTRTPRILCVDDDPDIQTSIQLRMRDYDVEVQHAFYGTQGIFEALKQRPDLILMDLAMPNGGGEYLLDCIKNNASTATVPVIVLTGMRDPVLKRRILAAGADIYLTKPIQFEELLRHIAAHVQLRRRGKGRA